MVNWTLLNCSKLRYRSQATQLFSAVLTADHYWCLCSAYGL